MEVITANPDWFNQALDKEHTSKFVEVNGARIEYMEWGNAQNQSVIMLHGTNAHAHWFKFIGSMLSDKYHFVVMSFSGMGGSDWRSFYTRDTFVDDVWGVVKDTEMEDPIVVGHSFGGMVSLITASKHSEDMSGLLLVDFVVNKPEEHHEWYEDRVPARPPRIVKEREELIKRFRLMPPQQCINQYLVDYIADHSIRETEKGWAWTFDPSAYDGLIIGSDHSKILSELSCPVGFYYGEHTIEFKEGELKTMKDLLPKDSPIFGLKDAQHHLMLDQPLPFIENLDRLIQELLTKSS